MAGEQGVRLSLAGAQDKLPVRIQDDHIYLPLATSPSTHLLKPAIEQFESIVVNEALCMDLARRSGLQTAETFVRTVDDIEFLVVKRYDREVYESGEPVRLHQEDFCQALGLAPEHKYQNEGGPSLLQCVQLIRETSAVPAVDLAAFMDGVIFNYLVGNNDAHGKNFSLIHRPDASGGTRLAPFYDLVCTVYYPDLSSKMAMKLGGEYDCDKVMRRHFEKLASETGLGKAYMIRRTRESSEALLANLLPTPTEHPVATDITKLIRGRCEKTLVRLGA
jgi:serine/threonine-protein kinase HipA